MGFRRWLSIAPLLPLCGVGGSSAQGVVSPSGVCKPASMRDQRAGCWILADDPIGTLPASPVFWTLDVYPTTAAANADKGPRGTVVESLGKVWLLTIEDRTSPPRHGTRVAEIGPLTIQQGQKYSAQYMEAIFNPGMTAPEHTHSGPEAWYTEAGETCLETSDGRAQTGRAGGPPVIVPEGLSMHLTATGTDERRSLVLILHRTSLPPSTLEHTWVAKGLCNVAQSAAAACAGPADVCGFFQHFIATLNGRDWDGFRQSLADDVTVFFDRPSPPERQDGRAAVEALFRLAFPQTGATSAVTVSLLKPENVLVQQVGEAAVISFLLRGPDAVSRRTLVLRKGEHGWQIIHIHASSAPPK